MRATGGIFVDNLAILKKTGLFDGLSEEELKLIEKGCSEQAYPMGTVIIEENDAPKEMLFIIKNGDIVISTAAAEEEGSDSFLTTLGAGDAFGEVSLIDNQPHSATVRAMSDAVILLLPGKYFNEIVDSNKNIGFVVVRNIARLVCDRLRDSNFATKHFGLFGKLD